MADQTWKELYKKQLANKNQPSAARQEAADYDEPGTNSVQPASTTQTGAAIDQVRRTIIFTWLGITGLQIVTWLVISLFAGRLVEPWWLWTAASSAVVGLIVWYIIKVQRGRKGKA